MLDVGEKPKIVFGVNSFIVGGEKKFITYFKLFPKDLYEFHLITLTQHKENEIYHLLPDNVFIHKFNFRGFKDIKNWFALYKCLRKIKPDLVVSGLFFSNTVFRCLRLFVGYKSVAMEQNTYIDKNFLQIMTDRLLSHLSFRIIAVSKAVANFASIQAGIPIKKFVVIQNGVDTEKIRSDVSKLPPKEKLKEVLGFKSTDKFLVNVARLVPQKNHELLIRSFAKFSKNSINYKLLIIGPGALRGELENLAYDLGVREKVKFIGSVEDVTPYYVIGDFFVSTSKIEGLSNAYLEAMACGLPIVATRTAGTDEVLVDGENGFFIDFDIDKISDVFDSMTDMDLNMMRNKSLQISLQFDIHLTVEKYLKLFADALKVV